MQQYQKPQLQRFGTFRELTLVGAAGLGDLSTVHGPNTGCFPTSDPADCRVS